MASNRIGRINEAIREALAGLLRTVKDPVRPGVYQCPELPG